MANKMNGAIKDGATVLGLLGANYVGSYAAGKNHDLRVGWGRKDGEELPLIKDYRVGGALVGAAAAVFGRMKGNAAMANIGRDAVIALGSSVTSTEAVRMRVHEAVNKQTANTSATADLD